MVVCDPELLKQIKDKTGLTAEIETWFTDGQAYPEWHYCGPHHNVYQKYEDYSEQVLMLREHRDSAGQRIRFEILIMQKTPDETSTDPWCRGQRVYRDRVRLIYEWRNNGGFVGEYLSLTI